MKKILLIGIFSFTLTIAACGKKENIKPTNSSEAESATTISSSENSTTKTSATASSKATTSDSSSSVSTETSVEIPTDPQVIYNELKGNWHSKEMDGNNVQWQAVFTDTSATIGPISGAGSTLTFKISGKNWDPATQRLTISNEAYNSDGVRSPENDYLLSVHNIDFENYAQMSVSGTTYATTDLTYYRD